MGDLALYAIVGLGTAYFATMVGLSLGVIRLPIVFLIGLSPGVAAGTNIGVTAANPGEAFLSILEEVAQGKDTGDWEERLASSIACHSAVRAGKSLTQGEMAQLLAQLEATSQPHTCPHGRPTMVHISASHLEREFGRR